MPRLYEKCIDNLAYLNIILPVQNNKPDYTTMETIISTIQKLVIKDVVLYVDRKVAATSGILGK
jgi:hypothetical protein